MEFREYSNPENADHDIKSSLKNEQPASQQPTINPYEDILMELVGLLEDGEWEKFGITGYEYMSPTADTISKVERHLENTSKHTR